MTPCFVSHKPSRVTRMLHASKILRKMGVPIVPIPGGWPHFWIKGGLSYKDGNGKPWTVYPDMPLPPEYDCGVRADLAEVLSDHGLFAEWDTTEQLSVHPINPN